MKRILLSVLAVVLAAGTGAHAEELPLRAAAPISGLSPFAGDCASPVEAYVDAEEEPHAAVNPDDPSNIVAVWQQDRFAEHGGARSNVVGVTKDGGATWTSVTVPGISECTGGKYERATDPWLSFGPDGVVYMTTLAFDGEVSASAATALLVSSSTDGGETWGSPAVAVEDEALLFNDKQSITADPTMAGFVYLVWARFVGAAVPVNYLSRSIDGGKTWLPAQPLPGSGQANQLVVFPDGRLMDVYYGLQGGIQASVSLDKGTTWLPPVKVGSSTFAGAAEIRCGPYPSVAVARDGTAYVAWPNSDAIAMASSTNGGLTWSAPKTVAVRSAPMFLPTVAVADDGTVGVTYYALREGPQHGAELPADHWLSTSRDGGSTWTEQHVSGPFDMAEAPFAGGYFVGDYEGLVAAGNRFVPVFVRPTGPGASTGLTDVYAGVFAAP